MKDPSPYPTKFHEDTELAVRALLDQARVEGTRIRIWLGNTETGKDWGEETDVTGFVGRSTGEQKVPLMLRSKHSSGGCEILDHCILRIMMDGIDMYRHPNYIPSVFVTGRVNMIVGHDMYGYNVGVHKDGEGVANFTIMMGAQRWIEFMTGKRMTQ